MGDEFEMHAIVAGHCAIENIRDSRSSNYWVTVEPFDFDSVEDAWLSRVVGHAKSDFLLIF